MKGKKILVTGGAGFIGSHLTERLIELGNEVHVLDNLSSGFVSNLDNCGGVEFCFGDIRDEELVVRLVKETDIVFHLAEYIPNSQTFGPGHVIKFSINNPLVEFDVSLKGTLVTLDAAQKFSKKVVFASTAAVYGQSTLPFLNEQDRPLPISPYGASKLCAETYALLYNRIYGLPVTVLRFFNVYGPRQRKYVMYDIMRKLKKDKSSLEILGTGDDIRDFIFVRDVVDAMILVADTAAAEGHIYNVGTGKPTQLIELINIMLSILMVHPKIIFTDQSWKGNVKSLCADTSEIRALGFNPRFLLQDGLKQFVEWFDKSNER